MMKVRNKSCRERQNAQRKGTGSMISYIKGTLEAVEEDMIIVETGGIGYGIRVPLSLLEELPSLGSPVIVHTYFQVREDSMTLYGFLNRQDREMFKQLISVNGIGPRGALGILSVMRPDDLRTAIVSGDAKAISRAPGIGPKTAQRLILDLKDKVDLEEVISGFGGGNGSASPDRGTFRAGISCKRSCGGPYGPWLYGGRGFQGGKARGNDRGNEFRGCA